MSGNPIGRVVCEAQLVCFKFCLGRVGFDFLRLVMVDVSEFCFWAPPDYLFPRSLYTLESGERWCGYDRLREGVGL